MGKQKGQPEDSVRKNGAGGIHNNSELQPENTFEYGGSTEGGSTVSNLHILRLTLKDGIQDSPLKGLLVGLMKNLNSELGQNYSDYGLTSEQIKPAQEYFNSLLNFFDANSDGKKSYEIVFIDGKQELQLTEKNKGEGGILDGLKESAIEVFGTSNELKARISELIKEYINNSIDSNYTDMSNENIQGFLRSLSEVITEIIIGEDREHSSTIRGKMGSIMKPLLSSFSFRPSES